MTESPLFDEALVRAIVAGACGSAGPIRPVLVLADRIVCELETEAGSVYFKASTDDPVALEAWAYGSARAAGVRVPEVLALDTSLERFPAAYLVIAAVAGEEMAGLGSEGPMYRAAAEDLAFQLRSLHAVALEGYGLVDLPHFTATGRVRGSYATWSAHLEEQVDRDLGVLRDADIVGEETAAALWKLTGEVGPSLDSIVEGRQLHGDLGSEHVFFDRAGPCISGLIDFADVLVGDPAYDLARFDVWHDDHERRRRLLIEAYAPRDELRESLERGWHLYTAIQFAANARFSYQRSGHPRDHNIEGLTRVLADAARRSR